MKFLIILADGAADEPIAELGGRTPLQAARKPNIDALAAAGRTGLLATIPPGFEPSSDVANLSVLGYDLNRVYEGRGPLEAASAGVPISEGEMVARCNFITIEEGRIKTHSAGHISSGEGGELIDFLQREMGGVNTTKEGLRADFFRGVSYRNLVKVRGGNKNVKCSPPHDVPGAEFAAVMAEPLIEEAVYTAAFLNELTIRSQALLADHPVNLRRVAQGMDPANSVWFWSPGYRPEMETLRQRYGLRKGAVISAVDLIKGIGILAGLSSINVEGATGLYDTNYEGKAEAALEALRDNDLVFLHIEASDEAGHEGDAALKTKTIEYLDGRVIGPIMERLRSRREPVTVALLPDHPTPCGLRTHTGNPVPFIIRKPGAQPDDVTVYDEFSVVKGAYGLLQAPQFMEELLK